MEMTDKTGQPRSDEDLQKAIQVVNECALKPLSLPPMLGVHLMDIRSFLLELQATRALILKMLAELEEDKEKSARDEHPEDEFEQRPVDPSDY